MVPTSYFGRNTLEVLSEFRGQEAVVEYGKLEDQENLSLKEKGVVFFSKTENGKIYGCRIYLDAKDDYLPSSAETRGRFSEVNTLSDLDDMIGPCLKELRPLSIGGKSIALYGRRYVDGSHLVTGYSEDRIKITYLSISVMP